MESKKVTVRIEPNKYNEIKQYALKNNLTISDVVNECVDTRFNSKIYPSSPSNSNNNRGNAEREVNPVTGSGTNFNNNSNGFVNLVSAVDHYQDVIQYDRAVKIEADKSMVTVANLLNQLGYQLKDNSDALKSLEEITKEVGSLCKILL